MKRYHNDNIGKVWLGIWHAWWTGQLRNRVRNRFEFYSWYFRLRPILWSFAKHYRCNGRFIAVTLLVWFLGFYQRWLTSFFKWGREIIGGLKLKSSAFTTVKYLILLLPQGSMLVLYCWVTSQSTVASALLIYTPRYATNAVWSLFFCLGRQHDGYKARPYLNSDTLCSHEFWCVSMRLLEAGLSLLHEESARCSIWEALKLTQSGENENS